MLSFMLEVDVRLDFNCCCCGHSMGVTLKCEGKGLMHGMHAVVSVKVPCPTCGNTNRIYFTPGGTLHNVVPERRRFEILEPSYN